jgi:hypothetical protein
MIRKNGRFESSPFGRSNAAKMADAESKRRRRLNATVALRWDHSALTRDHHGIGQVGILYCLAEAREKLPILIDGGNPLGCLSALCRRRSPVHDEGTGALARVGGAPKVRAD